MILVELNPTWWTSRDAVSIRLFNEVRSGCQFRWSSEVDANENARLCSESRAGNAVLDWADLATNIEILFCESSDFLADESQDALHDTQ